ncbi:hypothetical protein CVT24_002037 [Panaeolus cyanescens]|uniref:Sodium/calcium exchanger membrane region domain-containing protein n=1 Tax=Panaeolus cyanescens TaxID=181874 RepID=A0A409YHL1_9AGAR|nr:hypothetical protein CVT24_002037 [Panaeolus cyanescens]
MDSASSTIKVVGPTDYDDKAAPSTTGTRQRTHFKPTIFDEEKALNIPDSTIAATLSVPSPNSTIDPRHHHHGRTPNTPNSARTAESELVRMISQTLHLQENKEELIKIWDRFTRKGKRKIGIKESLVALAYSSWLNVFMIFIPLSWVSHFLHWRSSLTFAFSLFAVIPLEHLFDYGGEQMAYYLGKDFGDLLTIHSAVEATLAIILLKRCELQLLKSTIVGVVILHLLLVPGTAFVTGGARVIQQDLHPHITQLNHSLLTLGVLSLLLPVAIFAALNTTFSAESAHAAAVAAASASATATTATTHATEAAAAATDSAASGIANEILSAVNDTTRSTLLQISHGLAILLLIVYICSRVYLHNPPRDPNDPTLGVGLHLAPLAPEALKDHAERLRREDPEVNQWLCLIVLTICLGLLGATAEWLVESVEFVREHAGITLEWFGLILLPIISFAADGVVAIVYFLRYMFRHFFRDPTPPNTLAKGEAIDLSIQFVLFWMPFFVLLGWWTNKPLVLLFDLFEVAVLLGACFIVNYVTADSKTNWAEGMAMVVFYLMIALCAWFYRGQPEIAFMSQCASVAETLLTGIHGGGHE